MEGLLFAHPPLLALIGYHIEKHNDWVHYIRTCKRIRHSCFVNGEPRRPPHDYACVWHVPTYRYPVSGTTWFSWQSQWCRASICAAPFRVFLSINVPHHEVLMMKKGAPVMLASECKHTLRGKFTLDIPEVEAYHCSAVHVQGESGYLIEPNSSVFSTVLWEMDTPIMSRSTRVPLFVMERQIHRLVDTFVVVRQVLCSFFNCLERYARRTMRLMFISPAAPICRNCGLLFRRLAAIQDRDMTQVDYKATEHHSAVLCPTCEIMSHMADPEPTRKRQRRYQQDDDEK